MYFVKSFRKVNEACTEGFSLLLEYLGDGI